MTTPKPIPIGEKYLAVPLPEGIWRILGHLDEVSEADFRDIKSSGETFRDGDDYLILVKE